MTRSILIMFLHGFISAFVQDKPNILIIFPDDVGWSNVSAYGNCFVFS